jgi:ParB-like chromosome segregation protein Spo0J
MTLEELKAAFSNVLSALAEAERASAANELRRALHAATPQCKEPVGCVLWVPLEQVTPNDYNPNSVARIEMGLLYTSIRHDGYTQPCVTVWDDEAQKYCIVDGFHRYYTMKTRRDIYERCGGLLPIVVIEKDVNDRMAATVRHNRARGKHSVDGMANMVFSMLDNGWSDADICNELGMSAEELLRLKHITGFSKLFEDVEYRRAWVTDRQVKIQQEWKKDESESEGEQVLEPNAGSTPAS